MDDLPELPFELVLSYLSLQDRLRLGAVSRGCREKIATYTANCRVKSFCYSERPRDFIRGKNRWVSGAFAENFISSTNFESFFGAYGHSILSNLKHLRLCDLSLDLENRMAFTRTINSFGQLEELDIIRAKCSGERTFKLKLPMLTRIRLQELCGIQKLSLDAPRLREVRLVLTYYSLRLDFVHGESVQSLIASGARHLTSGTFRQLQNLRNLQLLYVDYFPKTNDSTFLSGLEQLKEIHLSGVLNLSASKLFEQKRRYGRADLKIYQCGLLLNGPNDPARNASYIGDVFGYLAKNPSRQADEIPFYSSLTYPNIESVAVEQEMDLLKRLTELNYISLSEPVQDVQRFLNVLKNFFENIISLDFGYQLQPQDLFDRLPGHCAVQCLFIRTAPPNLDFLLRLKHLIRLEVCWKIDAELVRKAFEELPFLSYIESSQIGLNYYQVAIEIDRSKQFSVTNYGKTKTIFSDRNAAIEFGFGKVGTEKSKKRKAEELE